MTHKRLWIVATLIACLIVASFLVSVLRAQNAEAPVASIISNITTVPTVTIKDSYRKGIHTINGTIIAPNACVVATADATLTSNASSTPLILLNISLPEDAGVCLQVSTPIVFSTTITAPPGLAIIAKVNGAPVTTTP